MLNTRKAFTMIEIIFVIVVIGILSSIAVSKMALTRDDAMMVKGRSDISAIRSAISLKRSTNMMTGNGLLNPTHLDALATAASSDGDALFGYDSDDTNQTRKLLDYPIYAKDKSGGWNKTAADEYVFQILDTNITFDYNTTNGSFDCNNVVANNTANEKKYCRNLTH